MTVTRFGNGDSHNYAFTYVQTYNDNFRTARSKYDVLMGVTGGISQYGKGSPPGESGKVTVSFVLKAYDRSEMDGKIATLDKIRWWGEQLLWMEPTHYPTDSIRFCRATVKDIAIPRQPAKHTDLHQPVTVTFDVGESRWFSSPGAGVWYWDDGSQWDVPNWVEPRYSSTVNASTAILLTNNGSAPTPLNIRVHATANVTNFELLLLGDTGAIINGFRYENTLASATNDVLYVTGDSLSVLHDKTISSGIESGYPYFARMGGNGFIVLPPGEWVLEVNGTFTSSVTLEIEYYDAWS